MGSNKSICWINAEQCPYLSNLTCFDDSSKETCSSCVRFKDNKDSFCELLGEEFGGEWVDDQKLGIIYSLLEILRDSKIKLSKEDKESLKEVICCG